jgi:enamine deaminase RidA (YjgF/YER057c/UK114 family)
MRARNPVGRRAPSLPVSQRREVDGADSPSVFAQYGVLLSESNEPPARTTVGTSGLANWVMQIEIEAIALASES